jgi:murein DD-endopeptidase MepM/ murein hydrolase activator NlpD
MAKLDVELGDEVKAGDPIGWLSNDFGGTPTTFHLHFEIKLNTVEHGWVYVSPYMSLVRAYERMQAGAGEAITEANVGTASVPGQP